MQRNRSWAFRLRPALLVFMLLGAAAIPALSGPDGDDIYEDTIPRDWAVSGLRVTDISLPKTIKIEWDYAGHCTHCVPIYEVQRYWGATTWTLGETTNKYWVDAYEWSWNANFAYKVRVKHDETGSPSNFGAPPMGTAANLIYTREVASGSPWKEIHVTPRYQVCSANQSVDSRLDLRYGNPTYKDFQFGSRIYRGGLFAGYAADQSKIGRSLIGFNLTAPATGVNYWTGSLNVYHTRNAATSTATVGIHEVSDSWTENGVVWSNAPTLTAGSPLASQSIAWDSASPVSSWKHFTLRENIGLNLLGDGLLTFAVASTNEATNAWAYFAKSQWDSNYAPRIVYATGQLSAPLELAATPNPVTGSTSTGTIYINGFRTTNAVAVLSSSNTGVATVPSTVTVAAGNISNTFTITKVAAGTTTITATLNNFSETMTVTVNP